VRQMLVESLILGLAGAAGGCLLAYLGITALVPFLPQGPLPGEVEFGLDKPALLFSLAVAVASALLFGLAPALYTARRDLVDGLKGDERTVAGTHGWLRQGLVAAGVALSLVLVLSAGLLLRSFISLVRVDLGFDPRNLLVRLITFPPETAKAPAEKHRIYTEVLERIASIPGVSAAAATTGIPPFGAGYTSALEIPGLQDDPQRLASVLFCTASYFPTIGVRFLQGNAYDDGSPEEMPRHAAVSRTLAARYFADVDPVGRHVVLTLPATAGGDTARADLEIVGVVEDVHNRGPREVPAPQVYVPGVARAGIRRFSSARSPTPGRLPGPCAVPSVACTDTSSSGNRAPWRTSSAEVSTPSRASA
jgi:putative ABC transport system permease protein